MTHCHGSDHPATGYDKAAAELRRQATHAAVTAKKIYPRMVAAVVVEALNFMSSYSWIGDEQRLRNLIADVQADAVRLNSEAA